MILAGKRWRQLGSGDGFMPLLPPVSDPTAGTD